MHTQTTTTPQQQRSPSASAGTADRRTTVEETTMTSGTALLTAALDAARHGWHVFPLRPGTKVPALHGHDNCPRTGACASGHVGWEQRATIDPDRIRAAWSAGAFNIGLATGPSGLVVVDLDAAKPGQTAPAEWCLAGVRDGQDVLAVLADHHGQPMPADTCTVATPSGGLHLYYRAPEGEQLRNTAGTLGWKIDTRARGGYVVASGSVVDGRAYESLSTQDPAPLPAWLVDALRPAPLPPPPERPVPVGKGRRSRYVDAAVRMECARVEGARKDQRNATLFAAANALGQLVAGGALTAEEHEHALLAAAARHIAVGAFNELQARRTIASGLRHGATRPREVA
jgi:hypothetical protein